MPGTPLFYFMKESQLGCASFTTRALLFTVYCSDCGVSPNLASPLIGCNVAQQGWAFGLFQFHQGRGSATDLPVSSCHVIRSRKRQLTCTAILKRWQHYPQMAYFLKGHVQNKVEFWWKCTPLGFNRQANMSFLCAQFNGGAVTHTHTHMLTDTQTQILHLSYSLITVYLRANLSWCSQMQGNWSAIMKLK